MRACSDCKAHIKFIDYYKQFIKNRYKYTCKDCGTVYSVTGFSIILNSIIMFIPMGYMIVKRLLVPNIIWIQYGDLLYSLLYYCINKKI